MAELSGRFGTDVRPHRHDHHDHHHHRHSPPTALHPLMHTNSSASFILSQAREVSRAGCAKELENCLEMLTRVRI